MVEQSWTRAPSEGQQMAATVSRLSSPCAELSSEALLLAPPYTSALPASPVGTTARPPLGSIVAIRSDSSLVALAQLTQFTHQWPWIVPCIALSPREGSLDPLLMLVSELRDRLAIVHASTTAPLVRCTAAALTSVRNRPAPKPSVLALWVSQRLGEPELQGPLETQFTIALEGVAMPTRSVATFSRIFARFGSYNARDWRAIARLCAHVEAQIAVTHDGRVSMPFRRAARYARMYVRAPYHVMMGRCGWESLLEACLRTATYL